MGGPGARFSRVWDWLLISATEELRRQLTELATELSYQKSSRWGEQTLGTPLSPITIWRSVQERGSTVEFTAESAAELRLEVDGTRLPVGPKTRGEAVHLAFAIGERRRECGRWRREKRLVGLGLGPESWPEALPEDLSPRLVVNDGGVDVEPAVADRYPEGRAQRCEWHLAYGLDYRLWRDGVAKSERDRYSRELRERIFASPSDGSRRARIRRWTRTTFADDSQGRRYVERAVGKVCYPEPSTLRTTSHAEREMRESNRRTDIGAPWTLDRQSATAPARPTTQPGGLRTRLERTSVRSRPRGAGVQLLDVNGLIYSQIIRRCSTLYRILRC